MPAMLKHWVRLPNITDDDGIFDIAGPYTMSEHVRQMTLFKDSGTGKRVFKSLVVADGLNGPNNTPRAGS